MERQTNQPVRPASEYGERPAGAPGTPPRGEGAPASTPEIDERSERILGALMRDGELGEPALAREAGVEITQVNSLLAQLQQASRVTRTAHGSWRLTPAAEAETEPRPAWKEPPQGGPGAA